VHPGLHQPGDLIFSSRTGYFPTHVGIVKDAESYIHSPGRNNTKVTVSKIKTGKIGFKGEGSGNQLFLENPIGYKSPTIPISSKNYRYTQKPI
jgi:cell wall-associated NlpC family hydrolase